MTLRAVVSLALSTAVIIAAPVFAQKGSSGSRSSGSSSSHRTGSAKSGSTERSGKHSSTESGEKTVHVRGYTRKDGTTVAAYDRGAPGTAALPSLAAVPRATVTLPSQGLGTITPLRTYVGASGSGITVGRDAQGHLFMTNVRRSGVQPLPIGAITSLSTAAAAPVASASPLNGSQTAGSRITRRTPLKKTVCATCPRDDTGRIACSEAAKRAFMRQSGFPNGRPGYVIDHKKALACGGVDAPSNMQWQTIADAKAKDKVERVGCK